MDRQFACYRNEKDNMLDFLAIAATVGFFLVSLAYVVGCEKL